MTPLGRALARQIAADGPISIEQFMAACLADPEHGYYRNADPLGARGDFTTAPEASQMFGELIGAWAATVWAMLGRPDPVILAELGPGRGTLMADARRVLQRTAPEFLAAARLHLVELNPRLRAHQAAALADMTPVWLEQADGLPRAPLILIANEFLDALPIEQFVRANGAWHRRRIAVDPAQARFRFTVGERVDPADAGLRAEAADGAIAERRPAAIALARSIGARLRRGLGVALFVDYGYAAEALGDTLQAISGHRPVDPLESPGVADLSAHVDFAAFADAAGGVGARAQGPVPQASFLRRLGIDARAATLVRQATPAQAGAIAAGYRTLIDSERMGTLFKALALSSPALSTLPGFDLHDR